MSAPPLRVGTRGSALARAQAGALAELLEGPCELVLISTTGDRAGSPPTDKRRWVAEIELALQERRIDLAVHSAKDVPGELAEGLTLLDPPPRADPRDVLCGAEGLAALPAGARVGTSSLRRAAQLLALREDLQVTALRGNVDTRLRRLQEDDLDAIVLAAAGLERLGASAPVQQPLDELVPAAGQGTLGLEARADDARVRELCAPIADPATARVLVAERALVRALGADCHTPVGALAQESAHALEVEAFVGLPDGSAWVRDRLSGPRDDPGALGREVAERMLAAGAGELLERARAGRPAA